MHIHIVNTKDKTPKEVQKPIFTITENDTHQRTRIWFYRISISRERNDAALPNNVICKRW